MGRSKRLVKLSKRLSFLLRHHPEAEDLVLDEEGFTLRTVEELAERLDVSPKEIYRVVETDPKGRFSLRDGRIRANYGHSISVGRTMLAQRSPASIDDLPGELYHGTAPRNVSAIRNEGLTAQGRQMVHLSTSVEEARRVGRRHAPTPRIFVIDVQNALESDVKMWKAGPDTVLATDIPPACLTLRGA